MLPLSVAALLVFTGCQDTVDAPARPESQPTQVAERKSAAEPGQVTTAEVPAEVNRVPAVIASGKVEFRIGEGIEVGSFKARGADAVKFYDKDGVELCKLTFSDSKIKAKSPDDQPLFELKHKDLKVMLKDASGENELFKFKIKGQNLDFYTPGDRRLYRIRHKDYGYALEDNNDNTLYRAKRKDDRIVLRDLNDETQLYSNDLQEPLALVFFFMNELNHEQQAACSLYFLANPPR